MRMSEKHPATTPDHGFPAAVRPRTPGLIGSLLALLVLAMGCEGPQGPQGEGVGDLDPEPPTVQITIPDRSDTTYTDTFTVRASATDNRGVAYVDFYLDGSREMGEQTARDSTAPYTWTWSLDSLGRGYGIYPMIARAVDLSDNLSDSPPLLMSYLPLPVDDVLYYFGFGDELTYMTLPDNFDDRWFNVRFTPSQPCRLLEIHLELLDPQSQTVQFLPESVDDPVVPVIEPSDITVFAWASGSNRMPTGAPLDSLFLAASEAVYSPLWWEIDVSTWGLEFDAGEDFHAGWSVPGDQSYSQLLADQKAMAIICHIDPEQYVDPSFHRSIEWNADVGWGSMQHPDHWETKLDFHIRAKIEYTDGTVAMLAPDDDSRTAPALR